MTTAKPAAPVARDADAELEALFAAIDDVILVLDAEGRYVKIAPTNPSLLYGPAAELLGKTLREVFDPAQAEQFMEYIRTALETRTTVHFEYCLSIAGREVWFSGAISPMSSDQVVLVGRDITERKRAAERLRASEQRFRALVEHSSGRSGTCARPSRGSARRSNPRPTGSWWWTWRGTSSASTARSRSCGGSPTPSSRPRTAPKRSRSCWSSSPTRRASSARYANCTRAPTRPASMS